MSLNWLISYVAPTTSFPKTKQKKKNQYTRDFLSLNFSLTSLLKTRSSRRSSFAFRRSSCLSRRPPGLFFVFFLRLSLFVGPRRSPASEARPSFVSGVDLESSLHLGQSVVCGSARERCCSSSVLFSKARVSLYPDEVFLLGRALG